MSDLISKQAVLEIIEKNNKAHICVFGTPIHGAVAIYSDVDDMPTVDAVPVKHGKWIPLQLSMPFPPYQCSQCFKNPPMVMTGSLMNRHLEANLSDYCPNCGAKMDGGKTDEIN